MSEAAYHELFPLGADPMPYRKLTDDHVSVGNFEGRRIVKIASEALTLLASQAFIDSAHLLRPGHLAQLRAILDDPEASANDKFVTFDLLKNANIAAGRVLPMCQDTGTAIVIGSRSGPRETTARHSRPASGAPIPRPICATASWPRCRCMRR
jgi:fumarate hydratase class I